jgi:hypothetical protein
MRVHEQIIAIKTRATGNVVPVVCVPTIGTTMVEYVHVDVQWYHGTVYIT